MTLINQLYNKVVCVNLLERPDKKEFMQQRLNTHDIQFEWYHPVILGYSRHFLEPYMDRVNESINKQVLFNTKFPNEFGTMHSHYTVIKTALLEDVQNLFVFEDDCAFHKDWDGLLPKYMNTIPDDTDGILLYSFMSQLNPQNVRVKPRWTKGYASWSLLAYGMNRRTMERYVKLVDERPMIADRVTWEMMTNEGYNFYIATPALVIPSKLFNSDIRGENKNYEKPIGMGGNVFMLGINQNNYY